MDYRFLAPARSINRVFVHCSASDRPADDSVRVVRDWHLKRGFGDIGYHFFIKKDGTLQRGRHLEVVPAAQVGHNTGSIAVCLHGLAAEKFTAAQFATLRELCHQIHAELPLATFHGHCEVSDKACPVFDYRDVLGLDAKGRLT